MVSQNQRESRATPESPLGWAMEELPFVQNWRKRLPKFEGYVNVSYV